MSGVLINTSEDIDAIDQKGIQLTFTAWRESINIFHKYYHEARGILLLINIDHERLRDDREINAGSPAPTNLKVCRLSEHR